MVDRTLRIVSRTQGNNAALKDGTVQPRGLRLDFEEVPVLVHAFRRMSRELAYDACEMALTTYICARAHGVPLTGLPIFLVRGLHHDKIVHDPGAGLSGPHDLEGRGVAVKRGYTVTTGVWARDILREEHGVDLDDVTWIRTDDEHVATYVPPANVLDAPEGHDVAQLLDNGDAVAAVGGTSEDLGMSPLIADPDRAALVALRDRGYYPINHLVVVRDDVLAADPELAVDLFDAFATSKRRYVEAVRMGRITDPTATDRLHERVAEVTGEDPLPYGIEPNRGMLERLVRTALDQHIIDEPMTVESLFSPQTHSLVA